jgi:mycothiol synthase
MGTFTYRPFDVQHDFAPLVTLLQEIEQADQTGEDVSAEYLREQLAWPGHDPTRDCRVVTSHDTHRFIGYGAVFKTPGDEHADLALAVHSTWRRQGIGSALLGRLFARASELGSHDVRIYASIHNQGANSFLHQHDFIPLSTYTRMTIPGTSFFPAPDFPSSFTVRSYDQLQQIDLLVEAMNRGYHGLWGHRQTNPEEMAAWLPQLPASGIFLLFAPDGKVCGICRTELSEHLSQLRGQPTGLVDAPGVIPAYRGVSLYLPLLLRRYVSSSASVFSRYRFSW